MRADLLVISAGNLEDISSKIEKSEKKRNGEVTINRKQAVLKIEKQRPF